MDIMDWAMAGIIISVAATVTAPYWVPFLKFTINKAREKKKSE